MQSTKRMYTVHVVRVEDVYVTDWIFFYVEHIPFPVMLKVVEHYIQLVHCVHNTLNRNACVCCEDSLILIFISHYEMEIKCRSTTPHRRNLQNYFDQN